MGKRGGFDPKRMSRASRSEAIVPRIIDPQHIEVTGVTTIRAIGVGGAGGNAIQRLIEANVQGILFAVVNTDGQALEQSTALDRVQLGRAVTGGLGCGGDEALGRQAAESSIEEIEQLVRGSDLVFVTAGLGGGTGTGAAPIVADVARQAGALTIGVVTRPFSFEGRRRRELADRGVVTLLTHVDALLVVPNDRLISLAGSRLQLRDAFRLADDVMLQGIRGISDLITTTGIINVDFADVRAVLTDGGSAHMASGKGFGPRKGEDAAHSALRSPLLEKPFHGATRILVNCVGGDDLSLHEVSSAVSILAAEADPNANIIVGAFIHPRLHDQLEMTVIAAGIPS
ncbi:MAG: cell division protein FtsZ [Chloroflexi bacterium]|nr:cell division protein FtsZ [Chloroflexota bacterium]